MPAPYTMAPEVFASAPAVLFEMLPVNASPTPNGNGWETRIITPPANPQPGDWFAISDSASVASQSTVRIIVNFLAQGQTVNSATTNVLLTIDGEAREFQWVGGTIGWLNV